MLDCSNDYGKAEFGVTILEFNWQERRYNAPSERK